MRIIYAGRVRWKLKCHGSQIKSNTAWERRTSKRENVTEIKKHESPPLSLATRPPLKVALGSNTLRAPYSISSLPFPLIANAQRYSAINVREIEAWTHRGCALALFNRISSCLLNASRHAPHRTSKMDKIDPILSAILFFVLCTYCVKSVVRIRSQPFADSLL